MKEYNEQVMISYKGLSNLD